MRLHVRIALFMLLVGVLPLAVVGSYSLARVEGTIKSAKLQALTSLGTQVGQEVRRSIREGFNSILLLAENPVIKSPDSESAQVAQQLGNTKSLYPILKDLTLLDAQGVVRASVRYSFRGDYRSTTWYRAGIGGKSMLSEVHTVLYPFDIVMTAATPVRQNDGHIIGVLVGQFDLSPVWEIIENTHIGNDGRTLLVDSRGFVLASANHDELLEPLPCAELRRALADGLTGSLIFSDAGGERMLAAHVPVYAADTQGADGGATQVVRSGGQPQAETPGRTVGPGVPGSEIWPKGWSVVLLQPERTAFAAMFRVRNGIMLAGAVSLAVVLLLSSLLSHHVSSRVGQIMTMARNLGESGFTPSVRDLGDDEIGELGRMLATTCERLSNNDMELRIYQQDLERLVASRTRDLEQANRDLFREIEERRRAESELEGINRRLEEMVAERTADLAGQAAQLEDANRRLKELDEIKSGFLSSVSHELRTPLTSVLGFAKLISRDFARLFMPKAEGEPKLQRSGIRIQHNLAIISREGERLTRLIEELLDLSKIESGRMVWHDSEVEPAACIEQAVNVISPELALKPRLRLVQEVAPELPALRIDPDRLVQVLVNLLSNAVKFTAEGSVSLRASAPNGELHLAVTDTGPGIPQEDLGNVFDKFHQVRHGDTLSSKPKGTGLGLAICRQIVTHYGGRIWAESQQGQGTTLYVRLPLTRTDAVQPDDSGLPSV